MKLVYPDAIPYFFVTSKCRRRLILTAYLPLFDGALPRLRAPPNKNAEPSALSRHVCSKEILRRTQLFELHGPLSQHGESYPSRVAVNPCFVWCVQSGSSAESPSVYCI